MKKETYRLETVTPLFSYGSAGDSGHPEIRPASIRGQLHQWFRLAGGSFLEEREVFGGISIKKEISPTGEELQDCGSAVMVRVSDLSPDVQIRDYATLPHKEGGRHKRGEAASKPAFPPGTCFTLHILWKQRKLSDAARKKFAQALNLWLLLGGLGTRANRGGGSLQCVDEAWPHDVTQWSQMVKENLHQSKLKIGLHPSVFESEEAARRVITDTLGGPSNAENAASDLAKLHYPLGVVRDRKANQNAHPSRKTSPLKFRVYKFANDYRIICACDGRIGVTGNSTEDFGKIKKLLLEKGKTIGAAIP